LYSDGQLQVTAVNALGVGDNRQSILGDVVFLTSGTVFADDLDTKLEHATPVYSAYPTYIRASYFHYIIVTLMHVYHNRDT